MTKAEKLRVDKWLWQARFFKSRALAAKVVESGIRVDSTKVSKPSRTVSPGDVLTFAQGRQIRVVRILALGSRRGPATEAQELYEDLTPKEERSEKSAKHVTPVPKFEGGGRPSKKDRRQITKLGRGSLE